MAGVEHGSASSADPALLERLRAIATGQPGSRTGAFDVAERQATLLLAAARLSAPPITESILAHVPTITVRRWKGLPRQAMLLPKRLHWLILLEADDDEREQLFGILHELKHLIDAPQHPPGDGHASAPRIEGLCEHFAACVLMPRAWIRRDCHNGACDVDALAKRYRVPPKAMRHRLATLGFLPSSAGGHVPRSRCRSAARKSTKGRPS